MRNLEPNVLAAVLEAYRPEGVVIWLKNWMSAAPNQLARMEAGVLIEWSGHWPQTANQSQQALILEEDDK